jgi:hypothetical protein
MFQVGSSFSSASVASFVCLFAGFDFDCFVQAVFNRENGFYWFCVRLAAFAVFIARVGFRLLSSTLELRASSSASLRSCGFNSFLVRVGSCPGW